MASTVLQLLFSPAGTTKRIADIICAGIDSDYTSIDLSKKVSETVIESGKTVVAAVPVFGGRMPSIAKERIQALSFKGNPAIAVVVYGNRAYDDALLELKDTLTECGCKVIAAAAFVGQHSMLNNIAAGRPNAQDLETASHFSDLVQNKLASEDIAEVIVPGNPDYKNKTPKNGMAPKANKNCTACGLCAENCPVHAIPKSNPATTEKSCIGCMRCVAVCPKQARCLSAPVRFIAGLALSSAKKTVKEPELFL